MQEHTKKEPNICAKYSGTLGIAFYIDKEPSAKELHHTKKKKN